MFRADGRLVYNVFFSIHIIRYGYFIRIHVYSNIQVGGSQQVQPGALVQFSIIVAAHKEIGELRLSYLYDDIFNNELDKLVEI